MNSFFWICVSGTYFAGIPLTLIAFFACGVFVFNILHYVLLYVVRWLDNVVYWPIFLSFYSLFSMWLCANKCDDSSSYVFYFLRSGFLNRFNLRRNSSLNCCLAWLGILVIFGKDLWALLVIGFVALARLLVHIVCSTLHTSIISAFFRMGVTLKRPFVWCCSLLLTCLYIS